MLRHRLLALAAATLAATPPPVAPAPAAAPRSPAVPYSNTLS